MRVAISIFQSGAKSLQAADAIEVTVERGAALTRQLLGFSRRQQLEPQTVVLSERMPGLKTILVTSLPANVQLVASVCRADPSELEAIGPEPLFATWTQMSGDN